jgi:3-phosphoshikimate 1-carboxyvinyltransferase
MQHCYRIERRTFSPEKTRPMLWKVRKSTVSGTLTVPPSKSHTIRALCVATLARGESSITGALLEGDGRSALDAAVSLGAEYFIAGDTLHLNGIGRDFSRGVHDLNLGNSGTGTRLFTSAAALGTKPRRFDGDDSLRTRLMKPLLDSLKDLGATYTIHQDTGDIPFTVRGPISGGETTVSGLSSQFLSSLLLCAPLAPQDTTIHVKNLHERPYVEITLWWLDKMGISYSVTDGFSTFTVRGNQSYKPINLRIPGDFSSATFGAVCAAITGGPVTLANIDFSDPQGDKEIFTVLETMGVRVARDARSATVNTDRPVRNIELDLNTMPDALPAFSVLGCFAEGEMRIVNVRQARIKETDRIAVMTAELAKMGAHIEEREDGLIVRHSKLTGCTVNGHGDHRVVMALALAGMAADGETVIETAESASVTYPGFAEDFKAIGADIEAIEL